MNNRKKFKAPPKKYQPKGLEVVHEDLDLLIVNKAAGLLTMGNEKEGTNTAYNHLTNYVQKGNPKSHKRIFIVHRLDRETSGLLVFAKSPEAKSHLQKNWPTTQKIYHAVIKGEIDPPEGTITSYLGEIGVHKVFSSQDPKQGKLSTTNYKTIKTNQNHSLLEIEILTGRKHQIRIHLKSKGHPIVGDKKYGEKHKGVKQLALHASRLTFTHPFSKEEMTFTAPYPHFFHNLTNTPKK